MGGLGVPPSYFQTSPSHGGVWGSPPATSSPLLPAQYQPPSHPTIAGFNMVQRLHVHVPVTAPATPCLRSRSGCVSGAGSGSIRLRGSSTAACVRLDTITPNRFWAFSCRQGRNRHISTASPSATDSACTGCRGSALFCFMKTASPTARGRRLPSALSGGAAGGAP